MKTANAKTVKNQERDNAICLSLSREEQHDLTVAFSQVESTVRLVSESCFDHSHGDSEEARRLMDASLILENVETQLKSIRELLNKSEC